MYTARADSYPQAVVAFSGARDHYQLPLALHEGDLLHTFVTELYWPADRRWFASTVGSWLPRRMLAARWCPEMGSRRTHIAPKALLSFALMQAFSRPDLMRYHDRALGDTARRIALRNGAALFSYSYYAAEAFRSDRERPEQRILFQLHPDPRTVRRILLEEIERVPAARASLEAEVELSATEREFEALASEPHLANGWVAASSFTARTLAEHGIPLDQIQITPYGVEVEHFPARLAPPAADSPFTVIFVGSMIQRKGLSYLLDAVRMLGTRQVRVLLCGRGFIDRALIGQYSDITVEVKVGLPRAELVRQIQASDVLVLPSLVEGFAHVILETMSCGVPVVATDHTCAPDVLDDGQHGFIVPIRSAEAIAGKLAWGLDHRAELAEMGAAAARQAGQFTWPRFREGVRRAYQGIVDQLRGTPGAVR
mgnify:CR=1 FL=1